MPDLVERLLAQRDAILFGGWAQCDITPGTACLGWKNGTHQGCYIGEDADLLIQQVLGERGHHHRMIDFNDAEGRTEQEVLDVLDEAIRRAKAGVLQGTTDSETEA